MNKEEILKGTTTTDQIEWQNTLSIPELCGEIILEIKSETTHFLTFTCTFPKDHQGDCILNLNWGDTEIELKKKHEVDRHE